MRRFNKYNACKVYAYGVTFDSKLEKDYAAHLLLLEKAKEIKDLTLKPSGIEIIPGIRYNPDFSFTEVSSGLKVVVDTKGSATKAGRFPTIKKLWKLFMAPYLLRVVERGRGGTFIVTKEIHPLDLNESFLQIQQLRH